MTIRRTAYYLAILLGAMMLAACASTATTAPTLTATAPPDTSMPTQATTVALATETAIPSPTEKPLLVDPAELPSPYVGPLPDGAVARLGTGTTWNQEVSPDKTSVAIGTTACLLVYDSTTLALRWVGPTAEGVSVIAWAHDSSKVAAGLYDGSVVAWDAQTGRQLLNALSDDGNIDHLDWTPDGRYLVAAARRGAAFIIDAISGAGLHRMAYTEKSYITDYGDPNTLIFGALSPDGKKYVTHYEYGGDSGPRMPGTTFAIWNVPSGRQDRFITTGNGTIQSFAWSPDSKLLLAGSGYGDMNIRDVSTGQVIGKWQGNLARNVYWSPDGTKIFGDNNVIDAATQTILYSVDDGRYGNGFLGWSADSSRFTVYDWESTVTTYDARNGQPLSAHRPLSPQDAARYFLPTLASRNRIREWDVARGEFTETLFDGTSEVTDLAWSSDALTLDVTSGGLTTTWNVASAKPISEAVTGVGVYPFRLFPPSYRHSPPAQNEETCKQEREAVKPTDPILAAIHDPDMIRIGCPMAEMASPDGHMLAVVYNSFFYWVFMDVPFIGEKSGVVALYDAQSMKRLKVLRGHASHVSSLAFSPDGKLLATGSTDGTVILWDMTR